MLPDQLTLKVPFVVLVGECGEDVEEELRPGIRTRVDFVETTVIQEAKRIRKCLADAHGLKQPARLFWAIYNMDSTSTIPLLHSRNLPNYLSKGKKNATKRSRKTQSSVPTNPTA